MARIYLLGNPIAWYVCLFGIAAFCTVALRELFRARRNRTNPDESHFESRFIYRAGYLLLAWSLHYFPFFTMARTLYLHHYLPAYTMSAMVTVPSMIMVCDERVTRSLHMLCLLELQSQQWRHSFILPRLHMEHRLPPRPWMPRNGRAPGIGLEFNKIVVVNRWFL
jgi:dolichyl-phosphate-mannose--protein O-mannosyl transferase